jgi:predicted nuclease with TOPRIM domain
MNLDYISKRSDKQDAKIERLYERVSQLEIQNALVNEKLSLLLEKLESVTALKSDIDSIKSALSQQKETKSFIFSNLLNLRIPVFVGALIFAGNWLYDLPSPAQQAAHKTVTQN